MKDNSTLPRGPSKSKPTWPNILRCSTKSAYSFFVAQSRHNLREDTDGFILAVSLNPVRSIGTAF
jgi:hypothetical protein